ncbi:MAG: glycosyltransferase [Deltaproteobacteria bacterium]|nr:glycosyltransferase [Deltaproteobacteria bacterium]
MKILHVETGRHFYGGSLQVLYLLHGLGAHGVENLLVCAPQSELGRQAAGLAQVVEIASRGELDVRFYFRLCRVIAAFQPDLVHVHSRRGADLWGGLAAYRRHVPALLTRRVDNRENRVWASFKFGLYERIIAISAGIEKVLQSQGVASAKRRLVRSAVDVRSYQKPCDREFFRREFGLPEDALTIGVVAQLIARKGHRFLIAAAGRLTADYPNLRIIFFGRGPLAKELSRRIRNQALEERFIFAGFRRDLPRFLSHLDLLVHPALLEGLGVSLLQAAAAGVPVAAFAAGGVPEVVRSLDNGFLVEAGDVRALVEVIERCLSDSALRRRLGDNGRRLVESKFSVAGMVAGNLQIYREMLERG